MRPLTRAEIQKITDDFNKEIHLDFTPRGATVKDAHFFFCILNSMRTPPSIDWALVAERAGYAHAYSARSRFGQIRRQLRLHYGHPHPEDKIIPKVVYPPPKPGKEKIAASKVVKVTRKSSIAAAPWNVDKKQPSKFPHNHGQGYIYEREDDKAAHFIISANERDDFDRENEYQNDEIFTLNTYSGFNKEKNTVMVSDQEDSEDNTKDDDDDEDDDDDDEDYYDAEG
ncbi:hypothetical protein NHQ30_003596 [Ciborinia camelliae]|nr:hypothetical protein NHQ30_003596 [Ciborinia camelliae]